MGRLKTNTKAGQANLKTEYGYNVRSWTTSILNNTYYKQWIHYQKNATNGQGYYNGNIAGISYQYLKESTSLTRLYNYTYDNLSRLKKADYGENNNVTGRFNEHLTYDKHGNILTLIRRGNATVAGSPVVDNLTLTYNGNQLKKMTDIATATGVTGSMDARDFVNKNVEYTFNANGAMTQDLNKGISNIEYNSLNLPKLVDIKHSEAEGRNEYTYSASGMKLKTVKKWNPDYLTSPLIGSAVNINSLTKTETTDYIGNIIYEARSNGTSKTMILIDGGYIENGAYHFYIQDHLGNNRVVVNASNGVMVQNSQYYPFGSITAPETGEEVQPFKFGGKELDKMHGLNLYDFSARYYDSGLPRFTTVDPHAENYYSWSPYVYCGNNPMRITDPTGEDWVDFLLGIGKGIEQRAKEIENVVSTLAHEGPLAVGQLMAPTSATDALVKAGDFVTLGAVSANVD
ncbi:MAG: RHS repeat-associated core domain-containing protein, partial [Dysgonomonas sp.]|nr:RHS repeat-associated core domain-containing protein [Dysgonomonas sp.]